MNTIDFNSKLNLKKKHTLIYMSSHKYQLTPNIAAQISEALDDLFLWQDLQIGGPWRIAEVHWSLLGPKQKPSLVL